MQEVMDKLLDGDVGMQTLLVFHNYFQPPKQQEHLFALIEQSPIPWLDGYLVLARCRADSGETEKGRKALMQARAMQYAEKGGNIRMEEIEDLAETLGDEALAESAISEEVLRKTGFLNADEINDLMIVERELNEPLLLYRSLEDGELQTVTLRVVRSREPSTLKSYRLLMVEKRQGSSSSSEKDGDTGPNGDWFAESYLYSPTNEGKSIRLKIESLCGEKFRFIVTLEPI